SFVKFNKFLRNALMIIVGLVKAIASKYITWYSGNVFFDQGIFINQVVNLVWRQNLFKLQSIYPRCVCLFYIKIIIYVVQPVDNLDAEGVGVAKSTIFDTFDKFVFDDTCIS